LLGGSLYAKADQEAIDGRVLSRVSASFHCEAGVCSVSIKGGLTVGLEITKFRQVHKNTLRGFLSVRLSQVGLEIRDVSLHEKNGKQWLAMPSRPYEDSEGNRKYAFILEWFDSERKAQFESAVLALLKEGRYEKSAK
jgi:hypothetical protein